VHRIRKIMEKLYTTSVGYLCGPDTVHSVTPSLVLVLSALVKSVISTLIVNIIWDSF